MLQKKLSEVSIEKVNYASGKLVNINQKIHQFVDSSYDMNRAAFCAYGGYLNYFRENRLKLIFKTEAIDVNKLALSYGFSSAPRVKEGKFLKTAVRKEQLREKLKEKKAGGEKGKKDEKKERMEAGAKSSLERIRELAGKKTKKILKLKK